MRCIPIVLIASLINCFALGCAATPKTPAYVDTSWIVPQTGHIAVLPVLDTRPEKGEDINFERYMSKPAVKKLESKGFRASATSHTEGAQIVHEQQLKNATPEWIRQIGPPDAQWVFVLVLRDAISEVTFGSTGTAEVSAYLFDKGTGRKVWFDKGVGQYGQMGFSGMMVKGLMSEAAIENAINDLMKSFPRHPSVQ